MQVGGSGGRTVPRDRSWRRRYARLLLGESGITPSETHPGAEPAIRETPLTVGYFRRAGSRVEHDGGQDGHTSGEDGPDHPVARAHDQGSLLVVLRRRK